MFNKKNIIFTSKNTIDNRIVNLKLTNKGKQTYEYHRVLDKKEYSFLLNKLDQFSTEDFCKYIKITKILLENIK